MEKKKVLFISQEVSPFLPKSEVSTTARNLAQGVQEGGKEIRVFTPRFGLINERRHQLHEVIRLSGMNMIIDDTDHPLIIKVASISAARMQVYFIDNDEYFRRKSTFSDDKGEHTDNDERSMFFCRGVLETVKKLGWQPDVIHCNGWMTALMALYVKKLYKDEPHFANTKVIYNIYNEGFNNNWDARFAEKLKFDGFADDIAVDFEEPSLENITKAITKYVDGICVGSEELSPELRAIFDAAECPKLDWVAEEHQLKETQDFLDKVIDAEVLI